MAIFLSDAEREAFQRRRHAAPLTDVYWAMRRLAERRAASVSLQMPGETAEWWHSVAEHMTTGAMMFALAPDERLGAWVRAHALALARRPITDWVGPPFRSHGGREPIGHLETAHLCWAVAAALDLAGDVFTESERAETAEALRDKGLTLCRRWIERVERFNNWRSILNAGVGVSAAVLGDTAAMGEAAEEFSRLTDSFQPDGSFGESLQYGNYAALGMMLTAEALIRRDGAFAERLDLARYGRGVRWGAASLFYIKPLGGAGWDGSPRPRSANFNDSAAIFRPSADLLLHIAARLREASPTDAGLARWLFDTHYTDLPAQGPADRASFGFINSLGFLTIPLLTAAADPVSPEQVGLGPCEAFSCGDVLLRDSWGGRTIVAVRGGGDPLHSAGHLHGDLNSGIVVHRRERLLVDPGHCSYRNLIQTLDRTTRTHNTCTFALDPVEHDARPEDALGRPRLEQQTGHKRNVRDGQPLPPTDRGARRLIAAEHGPVRVSASEVSAVYGPTIERFARFWVLCGSHAIFIVDHIVATRPVRTTWHWLLNNRDGELDLKLLPPDRLVARRGNAGMKLFHLGGGTLSGPIHAFVHDAYHPLPSQLGEGRSGSGQIVEWQEARAATERLVVHAVALDSLGAVAGWHLYTRDDGVTLEGPDVPAATRETWTLRIESPERMRIEAAHLDAGYTLATAGGDKWSVGDA